MGQTCLHEFPGGPERDHFCPGASDAFDLHWICTTEQDARAMWLNTNGILERFIDGQWQKFVHDGLCVRDADCASDERCGCDTRVSNSIRGYRCRKKVP